MWPTTLHMHLPPGKALTALQAWLGEQVEIDPAQVLVESNGWTTFSLDASYSPTEDWLALGRDCDVLYETYSTSVRMAELVYVASGMLRRHALFDEGNPTENVDLGSLQSEHTTRLASWADIWGYVDDGMWRREVALP